MELDGSYSNEFEAAFDLSRREYEPADELNKIMALTNEGKYVVVANIEVCCKFTDAMLGIENRVASVHDTLEAAQAACPDEDGGLFIMGPGELPDLDTGAVDKALDDLMPNKDIPF